jgi:hypothetical protein
VTAPRLRQVVLLVSDLEAAGDALGRELPLGPAHVDELVGEFGVRNVLHALGDTFVELVTPLSDDVPAARHLARHGDGVFMLVFQVGDLGAARARVDRLGVRVTWERAFDDIATIHLHPADVGVLPISLDEARPPETWRWGGPEWTGRVAAPRGEGVTGVSIAAREPGEAARRWAEVLGVRCEGTRVPLDGGAVVFHPATGRQGVTAVHLAPGAQHDRGPQAVHAAGAVFTFAPAGSPATVPSERGEA